MKKRIVAFGLVLLMVLSMMPARTVSAAYSYDPAKAAAWAKVKANVQNTSGQCATFVSRCLREGGLGDVKFSTPGAMVEHLEKKGYGTTYKLNDESLAKLKAGDVIAVFCSKKHDSSKYWGIHTIFVTEVNQAEKYIRYSARNNNHYNEKVSFSWLKNPGNYSANCAKCGHKKNNYAVIVSMKDTSTPEIKYLNQCTFYSSSADLTMVNSGYMKSLPCSKNTNEASKDVVWITKGTVFKGVELVKNTAGNYWYKANYDGKTGYVYAGDVSAKETFSVSITGVTAPTGNREKGKALTLKGVVNAGTLKITKLGAKIYKDTDTSLSNPLTGTEVSPNTNTYSIQGSALDNNCKLGSLDKGAYNYVIYCIVENHITTSGTEMLKVTRTYKSLDKKELYVSSFTVAGATPTATYSVSYNANGGSGAPGGQTKVQGQNLALSSTKPTRTGYTFQGWSTSSGGSVAYQPGSTYSNNAAVTLYAIWKADSYTVSYNANGGSGAPGNQTKTYGQNLTLSSTKPARTGYTFQGWATSSGGAVAYQPGSTYSNNAAVTLYAIWKADSYTVSYNANGGIGAPGNQTKTYGQNLTLSGTQPTRDGHTFQGWATSAGGAVAYQPGGTYTNNAGTTLYAVWEANKYTVSYNANGGNGCPGNQTKNYGQNLTLSSTRPTRDGHTFQGWATSAGGAVAYQAGAIYSNNANVTLYAVWKQNVVDNSPVLEVGKASGVKGSTVILPVKITNSIGVNTIGLTVQYDDSKIHLINVKQGGIKNVFYEGNNNLIAYTPDVFEGDGILFSLEFEVVQSFQGDAVVSLKNALIGNDDKNQELAPVVKNGAVTYGGRLPGDVNNDGKVSLLDLARLCKFLAGYNVTIHEQNSDVNGDGKVSLLDLARLCKYLAGYNVTLK